MKRRRKQVPIAQLEKLLEHRAGTEGFRPFSEALTRPGVSVIAEHKRRSPSAGVIREGSIEPEWERFIADCALAGLPVYHVKQVLESLTGRVEIEHLSENNLGSLAPNYAYSWIKWGLDWLVRMQNSDGSLLCVQGLDSASPPSDAKGVSYYGPPTTSATLMGAAAFAPSSLTSV